MSEEEQAMVDLLKDQVRSASDAAQPLWSGYMSAIEAENATLRAQLAEAEAARDGWRTSCLANRKGWERADDRCEAAEARAATLTSLLERALEALDPAEETLRFAAVTFYEYATGHRLKCTPEADEKAQRNDSAGHRCSAIQTITYATAQSILATLAAEKEKP